MALHPDRWHHSSAAWIVLALSFVMTGVAWYVSDQAVRAKAQVRFNFQSQDLANAIAKRLAEYETALRGGAGLFLGSSNVSRQEWHAYVASLRLARTFPGIQGMGFAKMMPAAAVSGHVAAIRAEGFPDYTVRPEGQRDPTSAIIYLEPFDWRNQRAFGYDMFSEPVRRAAMTRAMESGEAALSGRVTLVQETKEDVQYGFLMYVPVYRPGMPLDTAAQRRSAISGFVYAPFRIRDLLDGILSLDNIQLEFEIYDGATPGRDNLLFDNHTLSGAAPQFHAIQGDRHTGLQHTHQLEIAQHNWTLFVHSMHNTMNQQEELLPMVVGGAGLAIDLFLFFIITSLGKRKREIERVVEQRTRELSAAVAELELSHRELVQARDDAEAASRAKSAFLANMSHELRTPMNGIMGMTALALRRASDPKLLDQLTKIDQSAHHLLEVINDVLEISQIEAGRLTLQHAPFRLGEAITPTFDLLGGMAADKGLTLVSEVPPELAQLPVAGDVSHLKQIFINLIGNAIKFSDHGRIILRGRIVEERDDSLVIRWEVSDKGIGIAPEHQSRLFNAFEQADNSMTRKYGGTGLGLAITRRLVLLMDGEIGLVSAPGKGSTFWLTTRFDRAPAGAVLPAPTFHDPQVAERLRTEFFCTRVLLVEDEPVNREAMREQLEELDFVVDTAEDGVQAVDLAKGCEYALILMDLQLPRKNGYDATRDIRALPGYARVPILAMTANAFDEDRAASLAAGLNDHLAKPVDPPLLQDSLLKWLSAARDGDASLALPRQADK